MAKFCLIPKQVQQFKQALKNGEIDPFKMADMTSSERRNFLSKYVGDNAQQVNTLFESKLLLKNQKLGFITWAKKTSGLTPQKRKDLFEKIDGLKKALNPDEERLFLEDFVSSKLGTGITVKEAKKITELADAVAPYQGIKNEFGLPTKEYMEGVYNMSKYIEEIMPNVSKVDAVRIASEILGAPRAIMSSADFSASFRQGGILFARHPITSTKAFFRQFPAAFSQKSYDNLIKDIQTDPFYSLVKDAKLSITDLDTKLTNREEAYMSSWLEKVPLLGPLVKGSGRAYTAFLDKQRFDVFKSMVKDAQKVGRNPIEDKELLKSIGNFINTATGRGGLGKLEPAANSLAQALFSPRLMASRLSLLNPVYYAKLDPFVRREAIKSVLAYTGVGTTILTLAAMNGAKVELDSRSADFGKMQIGRTRLDIWGGFQQYIRLGSQLLTGQKKVSDTGEIRNLGEGFGSKTKFDVAVDFAISKSAPVANYIAYWLRGKNFEGEEFNPTDEAIKRLVPIIAQDIYQLYKQGDLENLPYQGASLFGISAQTYDKIPNTARWSQSTSKEMTQFKEKIGEDEFKEAEQDFNIRYNEWFTKTKETPQFTGLSAQEKEDLITDAKEKIKQDIFKENRFKPKREKPKKKNRVVKNLLP